MNALGIYFGPKEICLVESKGKKVLKYASIPQSVIAGGELEEKVPQDVKSIEIVALLKDELRKNKIDAKEASISLSGKEIIIRTFEIPGMPKEELASAINFEAKKYIPFKMEELVFDAQIMFDKASRTNLVLFMGIKKEALAKYLSILSQLGIRINSIEYSAFSFLRNLKLAGLNDNGVVGLLAADILGEDEVNFTVFENGFPLFSRDISLISGSAEGAVATGIDSGMAIEKMKTEIRISLDYYHRKLPGKSINKIFLVASQEYQQDLQAFLNEIGLDSHYVDLNKYKVDQAAPYSLPFLKGMSSSLHSAIKTGIKPNLLQQKGKLGVPKQKATGVEVATLLKSLDLRIVLLGILICASPFGYGLYRKKPLEEEIKSILSRRPSISSVSQDTNYEGLMGIVSASSAKLGVYKGLINNQLYLTLPLDAIPSAMPQGMLLSAISFEKTQGASSLTIKGLVYLADGDKEFAAVNTFIVNLKAEKDFSQYFKEVIISSMDRQVQEQRVVTNFVILCQS
jgi:Tfp pilus assembly PilM family ATPase